MVLAAALLLAGCGEAPAHTAVKTLGASSSTPSTPPTTAGMAAATAAAGGRLLVGQKGTLAANVWYLRIEDAKGALVAEQAFPSGSISVERTLPQGDYRVVSWRRACKGTCPTTGESGLGALQDVCGALVQIGANQIARVEVAINPDGSCAVSKTA